jgi:hypothetical protein
MGVFLRVSGRTAEKMGKGSSRELMAPSTRANGKTENIMGKASS